MIGLAVWSLLGVAAAQTPQGSAEAPWYAGLPVADVQLASPEGGLPEESLEPLLRVTQGVPLDLGDLRLDLVTLYRVGEFSTVEADLQPWVLYGDQGDVVPAVLLTYIVHPAPIASDIVIEGEDWLRERDVLKAARIDVGEPFYLELDGPLVRDRLRTWMADRGFPEGDVEVTSAPVAGSNDVVVRLALTENAPDIVSRVELAGELPVPERKVRHWIRHQGVREGKPLEIATVTDAQIDIRTKLASLGGLFAPARGYVSARVTPAVTGDLSGGTLVTFTIEPGPKLSLDVTGLGVRPRGKVRDWLGIDERVRLTRGFVEAAPETIESSLQRVGYYAAKAVVSLEEDPDGKWQVLHVAIDRGPPYVVHRVDFDGNTALGASELRRIMDQASDEVVRLGYATEPELQLGVEAIRDVYRSRGYLDVHADLTDIRVAKKLRDLTPSGRPPLWRWLARPFTPRTRFLLPQVAIREGPLTRLVGLEITGAAPDVDLSFVDEERGSLEGGPFSPQALEALARKVVLAHREAGYLEADARVVREPAADQEMRAVIGVETGPLVRLRSVVVRGARTTKPRLVRREVDLDLGQPVTSTALDSLRRNLYDLDIFRTVSTELIGDEAARDLVVRVEERPLWAFELGGGIATDQGIRGFGRITRRNLWGLAHRVDLYGLLGFDWLGSSVTDWAPDLRDPEWRAAISYTAPRFPLRNQELVVDILLRERMQERTWQMSRSGGGIALDTKFARFIGFRTGVRVEARRLVEVDQGALLPGEVWSALVDPLADGEPTPNRWQGSVYGLFLYDRRDNPLAPTRGVILSALAEWAPPVKAGVADAVSFIKGEFRISGYVPIGGPYLRMTGEVTHAVGIGGAIIPLEDRYRLGGTGSLRGFRRDAVGPHNEVEQFTTDWPEALAPAISYATREDPTRWVETGGDTRGTGVFELLLPLPVLGLRAWDGYSAALFADVGNIWLLGPAARGLATSDQSPWLGVYHPAVRYGIGAGLRVSTPVGPLQVDLAVNPDAIRAAGEVKTLLRDEWQEPTVRFHLSLGAL